MNLFSLWLEVCKAAFEVPPAFCKFRLWRGDETDDNEDVGLDGENVPGGLRSKLVFNVLDVAPAAFRAEGARGDETNVPLPAFVWSS